MRIGTFYNNWFWFWEIIFKKFFFGWNMFNSFTFLMFWCFYQYLNKKKLKLNQIRKKIKNKIKVKPSLETLWILFSSSWILKPYIIILIEYEKKKKKKKKRKRKLQDWWVIHLIIYVYYNSYLQM